VCRGRRGGSRLLIVVQSGEGGAKPKEAAHRDVDYREKKVSQHKPDCCGWFVVSRFMSRARTARVSIKGHGLLYWRFHSPKHSELLDIIGIAPIVGQGVIDRPVCQDAAFVVVAEVVGVKEDGSFPGSQASKLINYPAHARQKHRCGPC
jgi:hypothetical protein